MEESIREALDAVSQEEDGVKALDILYISSYFAVSKNIRVDMFLCLFNGNEEQLNAAIRLLRQQSLIESHDKVTVFIVKAGLQIIIRASLADRGKEKNVIKQAIDLFTKLLEGVIYPSILDHAISVLVFASKYEELVIISSGLPSHIVLNLLKQNRLEEAHVFSKVALDFLKRTIGEGHRETLNLQHNLATALGVKGEHEATIKVLHSLYTKDSKFSRTEDVIHTLVTTARQLSELSKYDEALRIYQTLLGEGKVTETFDNTILVAWHDYALLQNDMGNYSEALKILKDVLHQCKQVLALEDDDNPQTRCSIAIVLQSQKKYSQALRYFNEALYERMQFLGKQHPDTLRTRRDIGITLQLKGELNEALRILEDVSVKFIQVLEESHPDVLSTRANMAAVLIQLGQYDRALDVSEDVYQKYRNTLGEKQSETLRVKHNIYAILLTQGKLNRALKILKEVYEGFHDVFGPNHIITIERKAELDQLQSILETQSSVHLAARKGDLKMMISFIENGVDVDEEDYEGKRPLHYAAQNGHASVVKVLLEKGATYNARDYRNETPLQVASNYGTKHLLELVKDLFKYAKTGNHQMVTQCISEHSALTNAKDKGGYTLLHWAVCNEYMIVVKQLLNAGANAGRASNKGNTPLHVACSKGVKEIAEILLQSVSGKELEDLINAATTIGGNTALHIAAKKGDLEMVKCLLRHGASFNIRNKQDETPIFLSSDQPTRNILNLICDLFLFVEEGNLQVISQLQKLAPDEIKAATCARNNQNHTLLQVAIRKEFREIVDALAQMLQSQW